jgi:hypothetical protein
VFAAEYYKANRGRELVDCGGNSLVQTGVGSDTVVIIEDQERGTFSLFGELLEIKAAESGDNLNVRCEPR